MASFTDKATLRARSLAQRDALSPQARAEAARLAAVLADRLIPNPDHVVSAFLPIGTEIDTNPLLRRLDERGITLALPVVVERGVALAFRRYRPGDALFARRWGLSEPGDEAEVVLPDTLIVPLAAFDRVGHRIGYGAGFYDRTLAALAAVKPITTIGYAFACQEVPLIPAEPHDIALDRIITEREVIVTRGKTG